MLNNWDVIFEKHQWGKYPSESLVRWVMPLIKNQNRTDLRVLEVGCGIGANLWFLAQEGLQVYGVDGSRVAIEQANRLMESKGVRCELIHQNIDDLPFSDDYFDFVIDCECLYTNSLKKTEIIVDELYRITKPGGLIYSQTFAHGTTGSDDGIHLEGEPNSFVELHSGPLRNTGMVRFVEKEQIKQIYAPFEIYSIEKIMRTRSQEKELISEWIISGKKNE